MNKIISLLLIFFTIFYSCVESNLPKQRAFLRIEFPEPDYVAVKEIKSEKSVDVEIAIKLKTENKAFKGR